MTTIHLAGSPEPVRPQDHAETAAEAVRALNHATVRRGDPAGYVWPADLDAVIAALQLLVERLPQALEQTYGWLLDAQVAGRVGHDTPGRKAEVAVAVVVGELNQAVVAAQGLATVLGRARRESSHLTGISTGAVEGGGR